MSQPNVRPLFPEDPQRPLRLGAPPEPLFTRTEAVKQAKLVTKPVYQRVEQLFEWVVAHYRDSGLPRSQWEPPAAVVRQLAAPFIALAYAILTARLKAEVDPKLTLLDKLVLQVRTAVDVLEKGPGDVVTPETHQSMSVADGVLLVGHLQQRIREDRAPEVHDRVPPWLRFLGRKVTPFIEAAGMLAFCTYEFNLPLFAPWADPIAWTLCVSIVVVLCVALKAFVERTGKHHNQARESEFLGRKRQAERNRRHRLGWGLATAVVAGVVTTAILVRALEALSSADPLVAFTLVALAVITGIACPIVAFMATAFDGSVTSRELDAVVDQLTTSREEHNEQIEAIEADAGEFDSIAGGIVGRILPSICTEVQDSANKARELYGFLLLQLGLPETTPPAGEWSQQDPARAAITNGLPGSDDVSLAAMADKWVHLNTKADELKALLERMHAVALHPWSRRNGAEQPKAMA